MKIISAIITDVCAFFIGGLVLKFLLNIILPLFHASVLDYWTCGTLVFLTRWLAQWILDDDPLEIKDME